MLAVPPTVPPGPQTVSGSVVAGLPSSAPFAPKFQPAGTVVGHAWLLLP
jgi:hypothetical protein